jgi:hypothetical protein
MLSSPYNCPRIPRGWNIGIALLFFNLGARWVGGQCHPPAAPPPGRTRYPLYRRLGGPQGWSERVRKNSPPTGFYTLTF